MNKGIEFELMDLLIKNNMIISCAESCTGGLIISSLINVSGASQVIKESYVTYSNESKVNILNVNLETIEKYHVESIEVAKEMVLGLFNITNADVCLSVTGFAGGNDSLKTDGLCYYGIKVYDTLVLEQAQVTGDRNTARYNQKEHILKRVMEIIKDSLN